MLGRADVALNDFGPMGGQIVPYHHDRFGQLGLERDPQESTQARLNSSNQESLGDYLLRILDFNLVELAESN